MPPANAGGIQAMFQNLGRGVILFILYIYLEGLKSGIYHKHRLNREKGGRTSIAEIFV